MEDEKKATCQQPGQKQDKISPTNNFLYICHIKRKWCSSLPNRSKKLMTPD